MNVSRAARWGAFVWSKVCLGDKGEIVGVTEALIGMPLTQSVCLPPIYTLDGFTNGTDEPFLAFPPLRFLLTRITKRGPIDVRK